MFFVSLVEHLNHLGGCKLKDDRIKCLIPSKQKTCSYQDHCVAAEDVIPDILSVFFGKINSNKIRSSAAGVSDQAQTYHKTIDETSENTDQKRIIGYGLRRNKVCQDTCLLYTSVWDSGAAAGL